MKSASGTRTIPISKLPVGEIGQIGGRGASLMLGYFDDQMATEQSFNASGWFMTGDLGSLDENGCPAHRRAEEGHHPARWPQHLSCAHRGARGCAIPTMDKAAAFPVADARLGERVCLAVVTRDGHEVRPDSVAGHLDALGLSHYDMPEYMLFLDELPLTASGKITKRELVRGVEEGPPHARSCPLSARRRGSVRDMRAIEIRTIRTDRSLRAWSRRPIRCRGPAR